MGPAEVSSGLVSLQHNRQPAPGRVSLSRAAHAASGHYPPTVREKFLQVLFCLAMTTGVTF